MPIWPLPQCPARLARHWEERCAPLNPAWLLALAMSSGGLARLNIWPEHGSSMCTVTLFHKSTSGFSLASCSQGRGRGFAPYWLPRGSARIPPSS